MPLSPMIGSRNTAAVSSPTAAARASTSPYGTWLTSPGSGANGACLVGCPVSASAPIVRPWKPPCAATSLVRPVRRESLNAASLASVPELQNNTRASASAAEETDQRLGQRDAGFGGIQVGGVSQRRHLSRDGVEHSGVRMPQHVDGDAAEQIQVGLAVHVGDHGAVATGQSHRRDTVVVHHHRGPPLLDGVGHLAPSSHRCFASSRRVMRLPPSCRSLGR